MIKVLIVEDSTVIRELLTFILSSDPAIQVIGTAGNGEEAIRAVKEKKPDIVTMDIEGSELEALYGGMQLIEKIRPYFLLSVHPEFMYHNHGQYERELHDLLRHNDYKGTWLDYDHEHHWLYEPH